MGRSWPRLLAVAAGLAAGLAAWASIPPWSLVVPLVPLEAPPGSRPAEAIPAAAGAADGWSLLLVTLDTVRPDRLGYHGNRDAHTPALDGLAREGVVFSQARSTAPSTLPSHASALTGLYPHRHGAQANGSFRLRQEALTLAELLAARGYDTGAFVSSFVLDAKFGLDQGFAHYDDEAREGSGPDFGHLERRADRTALRAVDWLRERGERPFFLWVHFFDPHADYAPPPDFAHHGLAYDGEIAFVDSQLARVLAAARRRADGRLLTAVTADHGEAFGAQGEETHSILLQEATLQVPFLLHGPGALPGGVHLPTRVSLVDLLPTLASLLGLPVPEGLDGADLTRPVDPERSLLAGSVEALVSFGWAPLSAIYRGPWKLVEGPSPELYDLRADPTGVRNVIDEHPAEAETLRALLRSLAPVAPAGPGPAELGADDARRLEALGYVRAGPAPREGAGARPDPVAWMPLLAHVDGLASLASGRIPLSTRLSALRAGVLLPARGEDLTRSLERIAEQQPDFAPVQLYLRDLYARQGRVAEAQAAARRFRALVRRAAAGSPPGT